MPADDTDTGLNSRTNGFLCFLKANPSIVAVTPEMLMCDRHLLLAGMSSRAASPGAGALLLCPCRIKKETKRKVNCYCCCREQ